MRVKCKTVTPLWTGGADMKVSRLQETGILGSLRWWYEVLLRGVGSDVRDPTGSQRSIFDMDKYKESESPEKHERLNDAGLCYASQVFGATGWQRRFRLIIHDQTRPVTNFPRSITAPSASGNTDHRGWYFTRRTPEGNFDQVFPREGNFDLDLYTTDAEFDVEIIAGLLDFVARWGALGARNQLGFGVVELTGELPDITPLHAKLLQCKGKRVYSDLPSLQNMFFAQVEANGTDRRETFDLKYKLRQRFPDKNLRHFVMGTVHQSKMAAKVNVSLPYSNGIMRVWGWVPDGVQLPSRQPKTINRDTTVQTIYDFLDNNYSLRFWREFNSGRRDPKPTSDPIQYLDSLLFLN